MLISGILNFWNFWLTSGIPSNNLLLTKDPHGDAAVLMWAPLLSAREFQRLIPQGKGTFAALP